MESICCNAKIKTEGKVTMCYVCLKCGKVCDVYMTTEEYYKENRNG